MSFVSALQNDAPLERQIEVFSDLMPYRQNDIVCLCPPKGFKSLLKK